MGVPVVEVLMLSAAARGSKSLLLFLFFKIEMAKFLKGKLMASCIQATSEAEAQCAALCKSGKV